MKENKTQKEMFQEWQHHQKLETAKLLTRRQFLGNAGMTYSAMLTVPSILSLITRNAYAAVVPRGLMSFGLMGGATFALEFVMPGNGNYLPSYNTLGSENPLAPGAVSSKYGAEMWTNSPLFTALEANGNAIVKDNLKMAVLCNPNSDDDSTNNPVAITTLVNNFLSNEKMAFDLKNGFGSTNSNTGLYMASAGGPAALRPAFANSINNVQNLLNFKTGALTSLSNSQVSTLAKLVGKMSDSHKRRLMEVAMGSELSSMAKQAELQNQKKVDNQLNFDPRTDPIIATAFGINAETAANSQIALLAAGTKAVADGLSPQFGISDGGWDYHDGSATTAQAKHTALANQLVGMLNAFANKGTSVMFALFTDGSTVMSQGSKVQAGDSGVRHSMVIGFLSLNGAPQLKKFQIGFFTNGQAASNQPLIAKAPANEGFAVFANYLASLGVEDIGRYAPAPLTAEEFRSFNLFKA